MKKTSIDRRGRRGGCLDINAGINTRIFRSGGTSPPFSVIHSCIVSERLEDADGLGADVSLGQQERRTVRRALHVVSSE